MKRNLYLELKRNTGATLLELLLVISVIILIIIGSVRVYNYQHMRLMAAKLNESVTQIFLLANQYYYAGEDSESPTPHCLSLGDTPTITLTDLTNWAKINQTFSDHQLSLISNPIDSNQWQFRFIETSAMPKVYVLQAYLTLTTVTPEQLQFLQTELNADATITNNTLTWTRMPSQVSGETTNDSQWLSSNDVRNFTLQNQATDPSAKLPNNLCPA